MLAGNGVVVHHGIHVACADQKAKTGLPKHGDAFFFAPVRLRNDAHLVPPALQKTADNGASKGRMVHICISCHVDKIKLVPAALFHIFFVNG
ncbi:uncharacterized protein BN729_02692 [Ruminococcus sp. CAG:60]|nr:uncharacterized protein BN729_02692 [Ruminococcus sp. CAG:60]